MQKKKKFLKTAGKKATLKARITLTNCYVVEQLNKCTEIESKKHSDTHIYPLQKYIILHTLCAGAGWGNILLTSSTLAN